MSLIVRALVLGALIVLAGSELARLLSRGEDCWSDMDDWAAFTEVMGR